MQTIEVDRISQLEQLIKKLSLQVNFLSKKMLKIIDVYQNIHVDVNEDIKLACKKFGTSSNEQEICLYDIYSENTKNMMNRERRIANLGKWNELLNADLQSQVKSKQGLEKVKSFAKENPNFGANSQDVEQKIESVNLLQLLYEASVFKIQAALADLFENPKPTFSHSSSIVTTYDKQGVPSSILKMPAPFVAVVTKSDVKPSAPSPPSQPPPPPYPSNFNVSIPITSAYGMTIPTPALDNNTGTSSLKTQSIISMPTPYNSNPYEASNAVSSNYGPGDSLSSASSVSASSASPVTSSSTQHSSHSPSMQMPQPTFASSVYKRTSAYLLTTALNDSNVVNSSDKTSSECNPYSNSGSEGKIEKNFLFKFNFRFFLSRFSLKKST